MNEHSLNVSLFVPLGIAVGLLPMTRAAMRVVLGRRLRTGSEAAGSEPSGD